ncbi:hypothetical protein FRC98_03380 [Lujinxingia vulgaris]|uniref:Uncharacterized protein n=1 Tax=Lujinxingia vulgaris TaxID=2600176 RepID=A0A5C6XDJ7_9DELT|nr:hypothetical protein FRC98_03380 [Lujinxingia vulgaris]
MPNSEAGHLFVDLNTPLAAGWDATILVLGPTNGEQICDEEVGCYSDHRALVAHDVSVSGDEGAVEIVGFEEVELMGVAGARVTLKALEPGQARVELTFDVEGLEPPADTSSEDGDQDAPADDHFVDAFEVEVREVDRVELRRVTGSVDPQGRYGSCPATDAGAYVFEDPTELAITIEQRKLDAQGELLRGAGQFAFEVDPPEAMALFEGEESLHQIRLEPAQSGVISLNDDDGQSLMSFRLGGPEAVDGAQPRVVEVTNEGQRGFVVDRMVQGRYYELQLGPTLGQAPLCGGDAVVQKQVMTPATCEFPTAPTANSVQLVRALNPGECWVRFVSPQANGGRGISVDFQLDVDPGSPTQPGL